MDASLELVDQNSEDSNRTEDLSSSNVFSKTMEEEWRTVKKKKVPPISTTRPFTRASKLVFK